MTSSGKAWPVADLRGFLARTKGPGPGPRAIHSASAGLSIPERVRDRHQNVFWGYVHELVLLLFQNSVSRQFYSMIIILQLQGALEQGLLAKTDPLASGLPVEL